MALSDALPQRGFIPVDLDRRRILCLDMTASWLIDQKYGPTAILRLYTTTGKVEDGSLDVHMVEPEVAEYFLWAALQADAREHGETLSLEQVCRLVGFWNYYDVFRRLVYAVSHSMATPQMLEGKAPADGDAAKPAASAKPAAPPNPGPARVSTSTKRSASRSPSSAGNRKSSGRPAR